MSHLRLSFTEWPAAIYAIGDVHGCLEQLLSLEAMIVEDGRPIQGEKWLITLGDHIDRGPKSAEVIEHIMGPAPAGFRRFALLGNHEQMMLDFRANPAGNSGWLHEGGRETLASYGVTSADPMLVASELVKRQFDRGVPAAHRAFLAELPIWISLPGWLFVHAGIRPGVPLPQQADEDLIWIREPFLKAQLNSDLRVVHGHTPTKTPAVTLCRIGVDTHCYQTGQLTAVRVLPDGSTSFLSVGERRHSWFRRILSG